jgi:YD repeat-containing protein
MKLENGNQSSEKTMRISSKRALLLWAAIGGFAALLYSPAIATETITFTYDALGRLTQSSHTGSINNGQQTTYALDAAGNRINTTTSGVSP